TRLVQPTADIGLSGVGCTTAVMPIQLVQSCSENDNVASVDVWKTTVFQTPPPELDRLEGRQRG
ncbi:hypothetical protein, partial [Burkholderia vietnamiensis]|uniref:hypothetical protein n=1 Tax=Burkholderia vietnamiensis TaxID=60552 RepID=UPI001ABB2E0A